MQTTQGQRCKEYLLYTLHHLSEGAVANTGDWDITRARSATKETAQASMNKLPVIMKPLLKFGDLLEFEASLNPALALVLSQPTSSVSPDSGIQ